MKKQPKISVITVVYNGQDLIEGTIQSVINQTYEPIEYLIIDGKSKDKTVDIIKQYESNITNWISESDKGLYDAMNKGLRLATGNFVLFMNAGDQFSNHCVLETVFSKYDEKTDVLYGEVMMVDEQRQAIGTRTEITTRKLPQQLTWKSMKLGMVVCHQAFIPRRELCPFYINDNLSADIDWVIEILKKSRKNVNCEIVIADFLVGGVSKQHHRQSLKDRYNVLQKHFGIVPNFFNHILIIIRAVWFKISRIGKASYS
ncbi:MAG: glycosyltransferase family 2 protein [Saprospiraceae bacterium]